MGTAVAASDLSGPRVTSEFERAAQKGWLEEFEAAAKEYDFPVELLLAVASRESGMRNIRQGNGYGIMQVHYSDDPAWCRSGKWKNPAESIRRGAQLLAEKRRQILAVQGATVSIRSRGRAHRFTAAALNREELLRVTVAAYSSGMWAYYHFSNGRDPDRSTYRRDYSRDVLARTLPFQEQVTLAQALKRGTPVASAPAPTPQPAPSPLQVQPPDIAPAPRRIESPEPEELAVPPGTNDPPEPPRERPKTPEQLELEALRQSL